jgi:hypothetical protein
MEIDEDIDNDTLEILGIQKITKTDTISTLKSSKSSEFIDTDNLYSILKTIFSDEESTNDHKIIKDIFKKDKKEKFQDSIKKEATRLEFAEKREKYKKHMKQATSLTSNRTISGISEESENKLMTKLKL